VAAILVVDDDPDVLCVMQSVLSRSAHDVLTTTSGTAALHILRRNPTVDLVISEAVLPGMRGTELLGRIEELFPSAAVMLTTAYTEEGLDPAIPCIQKPFTADTLLRQVQGVLARAKQAREGLSTALDRSRKEIARSVSLQQQTAAAWSKIQDNVSRTRRLRSEWLAQVRKQQGTTVLVVEDDAGFRYAVSHFLSKQGFTVLQASNHPDALRLWRDHQDGIDVLVTDLHGVDGLQLAEAVESYCPEKPIVFMTAAQAALPHPTLQKPFELDELLRAIRRALGRE
jgi:CheY-like chemotaxis protein